jgi:hypothetical protein
MFNEWFEFYSGFKIPCTTYNLLIINDIAALQRFAMHLLHGRNEEE